MRNNIANGIRSLMPLYEGNYRTLMRLLPGLSAIRVPTTLTLSELPQIRLGVVECCKYTSTVVLAHCLGSDGRIVPDISMTLRIYHDAKLVEVIGYQNQRGFAPSYPYPNEKMRSPFEKRQINRFLGEWLKWYGRRVAVGDVVER